MLPSRCARSGRESSVARAFGAVCGLLLLAPLTGGQGFTPPEPVWDTIAIGSAPQDGAFGKAAVLRLSHDSIADVVVRRGPRWHLLLEPGSFKHTEDMPVPGDLRDVAVFSGGGDPDALVTATSSGVTFIRRPHGAFEVEAFPFTLPSIERVAVGADAGWSTPAALALWAPSVSRIFLYGLAWNAPATVVTPCTPRSFTQVEALAVLDFNGDETPDLAVAQPGGVRVFSFAGPLLKTVAGSGQTAALVPFRIPGTNLEGLAWLTGTAWNSTLQAIGLEDLGPPLSTATEPWFGVTTSPGSSTESASLVLSAEHSVIQVKLNQPGGGSVLGQPLFAALNDSRGWALLHDFNRDACVERLDALTFAEEEVAAKLHRGIEQGPLTAVVSLNAVIPQQQTDDFTTVVLSVSTDSMFLGQEVRARVWSWPVLCVLAADPLMLTETSKTIEAGTTTMLLGINPPGGLAQGLLFEIRVLGDSGTIKVLDAVLDRTEQCGLTSPEECEQKTGDPRGVIPLPSKPHGPQPPPGQ